MDGMGFPWFPFVSFIHSRRYPGCAPMSDAAACLILSLFVIGKDVPWIGQPFTTKFEMLAKTCHNKSIIIHLAMQKPLKVVFRDCVVVFLILVAQSNGEFTLIIRRGQIGVAKSTPQPTETFGGPARLCLNVGVGYLIPQQRRNDR